MPDGGDGVPIHGFAVCRYEAGSIYRFSCNADWEVENDSQYDTLEAARKSVRTLKHLGPSRRVRWQDADT